MVVPREFRIFSIFSFNTTIWLNLQTSCSIWTHLVLKCSSFLHVRLCDRLFSASLHIFCCSYFCAITRSRIVLCSFLFELKAAIFMECDFNINLKYCNSDFFTTRAVLATDTVVMEDVRCRLHCRMDSRYRGLQLFVWLIQRRHSCFYNSSLIL